MSATVSKPIPRLFSLVRLFLAGPTYSCGSYVSLSRILFFNLTACNGKYSSSFSCSCNRRFGRGYRRNTPLCQKVATVIGKRLRVVPPRGGNVDDVKTGFAIANLQEVERDAPPRERRLPGRGWMGDAQAEAGINMMMTATRAVRKRQEADTQDSQLKRAVRRENNARLQVCAAAYQMLLGKNVQGLEEDLHQCSQGGLA